MTFKLLLLIFAVVNGVPSDKPVGVYPYNADFESMEACSAFSSTDDGMALRSAVHQFVESQQGAVAAKLGCAQAQDNTI